MPPSRRNQTAPEGATDVPAGRDPEFAPVAGEPPQIPVVGAEDGVERIPPEPVIPGVTEAERIDLIQAAEEGDVELVEIKRDELPFLSAGVASDLDMKGWAGDPASGGMFRKDLETGEITYEPRKA